MEVKPGTSSIFDVFGRKIDELATKEEKAGEHKVKWNARDRSPGIYFCRLNAGNLYDVTRIVIIK
ncbi:MAG: T9SS type A sorting domain-containing protein [Bacteroidales bacterium]|nr:T9SS type A sorting domain-containing protein [Bacteroidales bacterium]